MAVFSAFSDPSSFTLNLKKNIQEGQDIDTKAAVLEGVVEDKGDSPEPEKKEAGAIIINKYDPEKREKELNNANAAWDPIFTEAVTKYMDYFDRDTNNWLFSLNEADQNSLLVSLTNKLYQMIVGKVDNIDFGEIPATKGDITKLSKYKDLRECLRILRDIFKQYREDDEPIDTIENACDNIVNLKSVFVPAFIAKSTFPMSIYKTMTLAVINATSFMIAVCIEYIKSPKNEGLSIVLKKTGVAKVKDHLVYETLKDFNESCRKGEIENALKPFVQHRVRNFAAIFALTVKAVLVIGGVLLAILPMVKDLVYFFFASRARLSNYLEIQGKLLEMNAKELEDGDIETIDDKKAVINRQMTIANNFYKLANFIAVDNKSAEVKANNDIKKDKEPEFERWQIYDWIISEKDYYIEALECFIESKDDNFTIFDSV